jgi:predicted nucleic acid-binding protein
VQRRAARLLLTSQQVPLRTLDAIHLALAIESQVATLVTFDPRLREAAKAQGLYTAPD